MDFKPGDVVRAEIEPRLPRAEPPVLRHARDEGRRRRRLRGAGGAADRRVRLRLEHAGRGRHPPAPRAGRQGPREHLAHRQLGAHPVQLHRSVDRGGRRAVEPQDHAPAPVRPRGAPGPEPPRRPRRGAGADLRPPGPDHAPTSSTRPSRFRSTNMRWEFNVDKANQVLDAAGWKRGADGIRAKDGKRLKLLYQTSINAPAPEEPADRQAGGGQGGHRDRAQVGRGLGVLLVRPGQPGHLPALLRGSPDVQQRP